MYQEVFMISGFVKLVHLYLSTFKAINRGSNHAHRHRLEILRRTVQEWFEPCVIEISPTIVGTFPCIKKNDWYIC